MQNSPHRAWNELSNTRADARRFYIARKAEVLHAAVMRYCDTLDGVENGLLTDPGACKGHPNCVTCVADTEDLASCLTPFSEGELSQQP